MRIEIESLSPQHERPRYFSFYLIEGVDKKFMEEKGHRVFSDQILNRYFLQDYPLKNPPDWVLEVSFLPGVTDNPARAAREGLELMGAKNVAVASGRLGFFWRERPEVNANPLIEKIDWYSYQDFQKRNRFDNISLPKVVLEEKVKVDSYSLNLGEEGLLALSEKQNWALNREELLYLKEHFKDTSPTDVEMEIIAQTWSEHCKHKIFSAQIEDKTSGETIEGLYPTYIKGATKKIVQERNISWAKSVFKDNAGVVRFDGKVDLAIKVETHNAPSALDPYAGALTGILGVNRDILGVGLGARPIGNTDVFCVGPLSFPPEGEEMPWELLSPKKILKGVHRGVQDGGNKSGIPTLSGAIFFDPSYIGRPLVFCGTVGVLPRQVQLQREGKTTSVAGYEKYPQKGDRIFMVGGAIGIDGIHGATFSSKELTSNSQASAVQIGDPLTQKRVLDFLMEAHGLYSAITDNGAGGLASSVGEMALLTGGAEIDLARCPVKYPNLSPWQLMISESQERMTLGVPPENGEEFLALAKRRGVVATDIGHFNNGGNLVVYYGEELVANLDLNFLHHSLPTMKLVAKWDGPRPNTLPWKLAPRPKPEKDLTKVLLTLLAGENLASKEYWTRQYDQGVQGATRLRPFGKNNCPRDAGVIDLAPHGGEEKGAIALGHGLAPSLSPFDPHLMAQMAVDEAVRNVVAVGITMDKICLLDNFCWPDPIASEKNPDGEYKLGQLVRACQGLHEICCHYGTPLVSGKDSMKNDFRRGKTVASILPTLLVTSLGYLDTDSMVSSEFKEEGDLIYCLGGMGGGLLGSEYLNRYSYKEANLPSIDLAKNYQRYRSMEVLFSKKLIQSCHDISGGGLLVALGECCFARKLGAKIEIKMEGEKMDLAELCFNEASGRFIVSVSPRVQRQFEQSLPGDEWQLLGKVGGDSFIFNQFQLSVKELHRAYLRNWE